MTVQNLKMRWPRAAEVLGTVSPPSNGHSPSSAIEPDARDLDIDRLQRWQDKTSRSVPITPLQKPPQVNLDLTPPGLDCYQRAQVSASAFSSDQESEQGLASRGKRLLRERLQLRPDSDASHGHTFSTSAKLKKTIRLATATATSQLGPLTRHYTKFGRRPGRSPQNQNPRSCPSHQSKSFSSNPRASKPRQMHSCTKSLPSLPIAAIIPGLAELAGDFPDEKRLGFNRNSRSLPLFDQENTERNAVKNPREPLPDIQLDLMSGARGIDPPISPRPVAAETSQGSVMGERSPQTEVYDSSREWEDYTTNLQTELNSAELENRHFCWEVEQLREQVGVALNQISRLKVSDQESRIRIARLAEAKETATERIDAWKRELSLALSNKDNWEEFVHGVLTQMNAFSLNDSFSDLKLDALTREQKSGVALESNPESRMGFGGRENMWSSELQSPAVVVVPAQANLDVYSDPLSRGSLSLDSNALSPQLPNLRASYGYFRDSMISPLRTIYPHHSQEPPPLLTNSPTESSGPLSSSITPPPPATFLEFASRTRKLESLPGQSENACNCESSSAHLSSYRCHRICHVDQRAWTEKLTVECQGCSSSDVQEQKQSQDGHGVSAPQGRSSAASLRSVGDCADCKATNSTSNNICRACSKRNNWNAAVESGTCIEKDGKGPIGLSQKMLVCLPIIPPLPRTPSPGTVAPTEPSSRDATMLAPSETSSYSRPHTGQLPTIVIPEQSNPSVYTEGEPWYDENRNSKDTEGEDNDDSQDVFSDFSESDISPSYIPSARHKGDGSSDWEDDETNQSRDKESVWMSVQKLREMK